MVRHIKLLSSNNFEMMKLKNKFNNQLRNKIHEWFDQIDYDIEIKKIEIENQQYFSHLFWSLYNVFYYDPIKITRFNSKQIIFNELQNWYNEKSKLINNSNECNFDKKSIDIIYNHISIFFRLKKLKNLITSY